MEVHREGGDLPRMGRRSGELWLEEQMTGMPLVVEQWLEVPKILPQDRVLETARQIANHLDKRDRMVSSGKSQLDREVGCLNLAENGEKLKSLVDECASKVMGELQKRKIETGNQKMMVKECADKVVEELQRKMNIETNVQLLDQTDWTVQGGEQLTVSLEDQDKGTGTRLETIGDIEGSPRNPRARQVWLKMNGKVKAVDLKDESAREIEERIRRWMRVKEGMGLYVVSEGRRLSWEGLAGLDDGKTAEVMIELKGGMSKKKNRKNPWTTPSQSSGSEPEIIRTETGSSSNEERDDEKLKEVLEKKVEEALKDGGVLDRLADGLVVMSEEEKEKMMQKYEETIPMEVREKVTDRLAGKKMIDKLVEERRFEKERQRKVKLIKEGIKRKFFQQGSGPNDILNFGMYEGWRFGDVYICHPTYGEWAVEQTKPKMWKLKCFKFFLMRLADLERVLQREENSEQVNITRVEMCEGLMEEMAAEEQQAVQESRMVRKQECKKVGKQGIRWADMEGSQIEIDEKKYLEESQEDSGTSVERWVSYDMAVEEHEAVMQREEERMKEAEMNREKVQHLVQEKDWGTERREWDRENVMEDGSTREAFEPRGSEGFEGQREGERKTGKGGRDERYEKAGKERHEERGKEGRDESGKDEREIGGKKRQGQGGTERQEEGGGTEWQEDKGRQDKREEEKEMSGSGRSNEIHERHDEGGRRWQEDGQDEGGKGCVQRRQDDEQDEGGKGCVQRRQDDEQDEGSKGSRWQDDYDDDKRQMEKLAEVVRRQSEDGNRQDEGVLGWENDRWQDEDVMSWAVDVGRKENERSREFGQDSQRVNLDDFFRRYKREQGEQQQQGRDWLEGESFSHRGSRHFESRGKDGGCEQDERERVKGGIGLGKGMSRGQGKGRGEINEQSWEESWRIKKENWMNEVGGWMERDDLDQMKGKWRQEQWEMVRALRLRNDMLRMAECLGEEMASELARGSWRNVQNLRRDRRSERSGKGLVEQSEDSVDEKIRRLTERIDELEEKDKRRGKDWTVKGCSSESDEGGEKWSWDGRNWWFKVESKGPVNSRLRRKVARAVAVAVEQDSRKWKEGLIGLQDRVDWLQWQKGGGGSSKMWTSGASGSQDHGLFSDGVWDNQDWGKQFM